MTQGQWEAIMGNNPSWFSRGNGGRNWVLDVSDEELKLFPVENVSWDEARQFIEKLNEKEVRAWLFVPLAERAGMGIRVSGRSHF